MKKLVLVSLKTFAFFVGWAICASILPIPDTKSAAVWRFLGRIDSIIVNYWFYNYFLVNR